MYSFEDKKRKKTIQLSQSSIIEYSRTLASGATLPLPQYTEGLNEIGQIFGGYRKPPRNSYLGLIITKPFDDIFFVGSAWEDHGDNDQHDEDLLLFLETSPNIFEVERLKQSEVKKRFPAWDGYHHGDKSYLE